MFTGATKMESSNATAEGRSAQAGARILVVRMGAMGDIIHTLPAAASLKHSFAGSRLVWVVDERWAPLLEGNPFVDRVVAVARRNMAEVRESLRRLRAERYDVAVDFQGLVKSAVAASLARAERIFGFHQSQAREKWAALFYSNRVKCAAAHVVERNLELAAAAGAASVLRAFPLPEGRQESALPEKPFVLACPLAGWRSKQWPVEYWAEVARRLPEEHGMELVVDGPRGALEAFEGTGALVHYSTLAGLIHATRRAAAVVGVDSGPLHLAAALGKPGVAIYGPTDPARNGPYGGTMTVLRHPGAATSYKRGAEIDGAMRQITPDRVLGALEPHLAARCNTT
jgi:heptosyltransferase-1